MLYSKKVLLNVSGMLLALAATSDALATSLLNERLNGATLLAQSPSPTSFPLPSAVPSGTTVRLDGSSSMIIINERLKKRFEEEFAGTTVNLAANGTDDALDAVLKGDVDLAAVGRPLTDEEKARGLVEVLISREKIAIIVGPDNSFNGDITYEQFAQIFRGEITDWSELGGAPGAIRVVDRPESSDTRLSISRYSAFQGTEFKTDSNSTQVSEDDTDAVVSELGNDGIGYAIASQVIDRNDVKIVRMHQVLPDDARYPYSQPRGYVYTGDPTPAALAFLGFATSPQGQAAVQEAIQAEASGVDLEAVAASPVTSPDTQADPSPVASPDAQADPSLVASPDAQAIDPSLAVSPDAESSPDVALVPAPSADAAALDRSLPWWLWWLSIPILGGLLWWLLKDRGSQAIPVDSVAPVRTAIVPPAEPVPAVKPTATVIPAAGVAAAGVAAAGAALIARSPESHIILVPRNCREAYAYWEVPPDRNADLREQGGRKLMLRLYDVTDIDLDQQMPHSVKQFDCTESDPDLHLPIAADDRDYVAELGYVTEDGRWLKVARSPHVRIPACPSAPVDPVKLTPTAIAAGGTALVAGATALVAQTTIPSEPESDRPPVIEPSRIVLTPRSSKDAYAYWEAAESGKATLKEQGGRHYQLRIYDVTNINLDQQPAHSTQIYGCDELAQDRHVPIPVSNRDYIAEIGYLTEDDRWLKLARSAPIRVPTDRVEPTPNSPGDLGDLAKTAGVVAAGGTVLAAGVAAIPRPIPPTELTLDRTPSAEPSRIVLTPNSPTEAYAYWEAPEPNKAVLKEQGGRTLQLRIYDATDIDLNQQPAHSTQMYDCGEEARDRHVPIFVSDRDYIAEIGYLTEDDRWLKLARSAPVRIPATPTDVTDTPAIPATQATSIPTERCAITTVKVHSKANCFLLDAEQMQRLQQDIAVTQTLEPGKYLIRIKSGAFNYGSASGRVAEPLVLLWIYDGKIINQKTNVPVGATWSSLNGYNETLNLDVLETATLCTFFFDTYLEDNQDEVTVSVVRM